MRPQDLEKVKSEFRLVGQKYNAIVLAKTLAELTVAWSEFLSCTERTFRKLRLATRSGPTKSWSDQIEHDRQNDELLVYVRQARNADDHGLEEIATPVQDGEVLGVLPVTHSEMIVKDGRPTLQFSQRQQSHVFAWKPPRVRLSR